MITEFAYFSNAAGCADATALTTAKFLDPAEKKRQENQLVNASEATLISSTTSNFYIRRRQHLRINASPFNGHSECPHTCGIRNNIIITARQSGLDIKKMFPKS